MLKQFNLEGNLVQEKWEDIKSNIEFWQKENDKYFHEQKEIGTKQITDQIKFMELWFLKYIEVAKLVPPAIFAIREELELPIDKEAYWANFNVNTEQSLAMFKSFLKDAGKMIDTRET